MGKLQKQQKTSHTDSQEFSLFPVGDRKAIEQKLQHDRHKTLFLHGNSLREAV